MYIVVMWNQAGGSPEVADTTIYDSEEEAVARAKELTELAAPRRDRYTVHEMLDPAWLEYENEDDEELETVS